MENLNIKLSTGRIVTVEAFHFTTTYAGLLHGVPDKQLNEKIINNINYPNDWGFRKSVFKNSDLFTSKNLLKPYVFSAWLSSDTVNDKEEQFYGSSIVVIWLGDEFKNKSISEIIIEGLENFDWEMHAQNFNP